MIIRIDVIGNSAGSRRFNPRSVTQSKVRIGQPHPIDFPAINGKILVIVSFRQDGSFFAFLPYGF